MGFVPLFPRSDRRRPTFSEMFRSALGQSLGTLPADVVSQGIGFGLGTLRDYLQNERNRGNLAEKLVLAEEERALRAAEAEKEKRTKTLGEALLLGMAGGMPITEEAPRRPPEEGPPHPPKRTQEGILDFFSRFLGGDRNVSAPGAIPVPLPISTSAQPPAPAPGKTAVPPEAGVPKALRSYIKGARFAFRETLPATETPELAAAKRSMLEAAEATGRETKATVGMAGRLREQTERAMRARDALAIQYAKDLAALAGSPAQMNVHGSWVDFAAAEAKEGREDVDPRNPADVIRFYRWNTERARRNPTKDAVTLAAIEAMGPYVVGLLDIRSKLMSGIQPLTGEARALVSSLDNNATQAAAQLSHTVITNWSEDRRNAARIGAARRADLAARALTMLPELNRGRAILEDRFNKTTDVAEREQLNKTRLALDMAIAALGSFAGLTPQQAAGIHMPPRYEDIGAAAGLVQPFLPTPGASTQSEPSTGAPPIGGDVGAAADLMGAYAGAMREPIGQAARARDIGLLLGAKPPEVQRPTLSYNDIIRLMNTAVIEPEIVMGFVEARLASPGLSEDEREKLASLKDSLEKGSR